MSELNSATMLPKNDALHSTYSNDIQSKTYYKDNSIGKSKNTVVAQADDKNLKW